MVCGHRDACGSGDMARLFLIWPTPNSQHCQPSKILKVPEGSFPRDAFSSRPMETTGITELILWVFPFSTRGIQFRSHV